MMKCSGERLLVVRTLFLTFLWVKPSHATATMTGLIYGLLVPPVLPRTRHGAVSSVICQGRDEWSQPGSLLLHRSPSHSSDHVSQTPNSRRASNTPAEKLPGHVFMLFKQSFQALCSHYNQQPVGLAPHDDGEQTGGKESSNAARVVSHKLFLRFGT